MLKSVEDDIANNLLQWMPNTNIRTGESTKIEDPLSAATPGSTPSGWDTTTTTAGLLTKNFLKYEIYNQRLDKEERTVLGLRQRDYFFGVINKASFRLDLGALWIEPR